MFTTDGSVGYALCYDNVTPTPDALQLWTYDAVNGWDQDMNPPASLLFSEDTGDALVLGIDLVDIGLDTEISLDAVVAVDMYNDYLDEAPDDAFDEGLYARVVLQEVPWVVLGDVTVLDASGDGVIDAGESVELILELTNEGFADTGANLTATVSASGGATAPFSAATSTASYGGGAALVPGDTAGHTPRFEVVMGAGASAGQSMVLDVVVTDDDGNSWTLETPAQLVGLTSLLVDDDDFSYDFDIASLSYAVDGTELVFLVTSHSAHAADQQVNLFFDTDLDGDVDIALSTIDDNGDYYGGIWEYDETAGSWDYQLAPSQFEFQVGSEHLLCSIPIPVLGVDFMRLYAMSWDPSVTYYDLAPDGGSGEMLLLALVDEPLIELEDATWSEVIGNGDDFMDPGESWEVSLELANDGPVDATSTTALLSSSDADLTVVGGTVVFGTVASEGTDVGDTAPLVEVDPGAPLTGSYVLDLAVDAGGYLFDLEVPLSLGVTPGDTTADAPELTTPGTYQGDTSTLANDYDDPSACTGWDANSYDGVYVLWLSAGQVLAADLQYQLGGPDAAIYISDDPVNPDLNCLDGVDDNYDDPTEFMLYTAPADGYYFLVVDGYYSSEGGAYSLTLNF